MPENRALESLPAELEWWGREAFEGKVDWYGALEPHVNSLTVEEAIWQPAPGRRCIWEITRHITFWRYYFLERINDRPRPDIDPGSWSMPEMTDEAAWKADLERMRTVQARVIAWIKSKSGEALMAHPDHGDEDAFNGILGLFCHDAYHTGQIDYVRALMGLPSVV